MHEAEALKDGAACGKRVDGEVFRAEVARIAGAGGDDSAVEAAAAEALDGRAAYRPPKWLSACV